MKMRNQIGALLWVTVSVVVCADSMGVGIGSFRSPGSGFFPFWLGVILFVLALAPVAVKRLREERGKITDLWKGAKWGQVTLVMLSTLIYPLLLNTLGYLIATFLLLVVLFRAGESKGIWTKMAIALVIVLASYGTFGYWLKVPLPRGIL